MSGTRIVTCTCSHAYQDTRYGKRRRVANVGENGVARCTVCGTEHGAKAMAPAAAKDAKK